MLSLNNTDSIEVIIYDDSTSDEVREVCQRYQSIFPSFIYKRNTPALGAAANWNALLDAASGTYTLLLHHDEFMVGSDFVEKTIGTFQDHPDVDVIVADCLMCEADGVFRRKHLPKWVRKFVITKMPAYFFRHNVIGPTSCLVVRSNMYPRFDDRLVWLIDVDAYFQLRNMTSRWLISDQLKIVSILGRNDSITGSIRAEISALVISEKKILLAKYPAAKEWLSPTHKILHFFEFFAWVMMRAIQLISNAIYLFPSAIRKAYDRVFQK